MSEENGQKVALVVMPHPEEAEFHSGGTIARWIQEGWEVSLVICTDGGNGGPVDATDVGEEARRQLCELRRREQETAARLLGVRDVVYLNHRDGTLLPTPELRREIVRQLRIYRPYRLICPSPVRSWSPLYLEDYHPDLLACGESVLSTLYPASQNPWDFPELLDEGLLPHKVKEIYIAGAPTLNYWVDISETIDLKIEALMAHASQYLGHAEVAARQIRKQRARIGKKYNVTYAEEFHRTLNL